MLPGERCMRFLRIFFGIGFLGTPPQPPVRTTCWHIVRVGIIVPLEGCLEAEPIKGRHDPLSGQPQAGVNLKMA